MGAEGTITLSAEWARESARLFQVVSPCDTDAVPLLF